MQGQVSVEGEGGKRHSTAIAIAVGAIVLVTAVTIVLLLAWSTARVDTIASGRQADLLTIVLRDSIKAVARDQEASTVWDDAVRQLHHRKLDLDWLDSNLGVWFDTYYHHDEVYIVDGNNLAVYAMRGGLRVDPTTFGLIAPTGPRLIGSLRRQLRLSLPLQDTSFRTRGAADIGLIEGRPAIVSVKPIVPESSRIRQTPGTEFLHISVRYLDRDFLTRLAQQYGFVDAHLTVGGEPPGGTSVPLQTASGRILGYIGWRPFAPGQSVLGDLAPVLVGAMLLLSGIVALLILRVQRSSAQLRVSRARTHYLAFHDPLTGLANRALFEDRLAHELGRVRRGLTEATLLFLDLDRFKQVNDALGHPAGDELIRQVGARLTASVRDSDTVARLGGDEFAIIQADVGSPAARDVLCQRLVEAINQPFDLTQGRVYVGVSIGIALAPDNSCEPVEITRFADLAMYESKARGRGQFTLFQRDMDLHHPDSAREREPLPSPILIEASSVNKFAAGLNG